MLIRATMVPQKVDHTNVLPLTHLPAQTHSHGCDPLFVRPVVEQLGEQLTRAEHETHICTGNQADR